jgi:hypothetical protein
MHSDLIIEGLKTATAVAALMTAALPFFKKTHATL